MNRNFKRSAFFIPLAILLLGSMIQILFGIFPIDLFKYPINIITGIEIIAIIILIYIFLKNNPFVKFFYSGYAALSSISLFTVLVILMVAIPQNESNSLLLNKLGLIKIIHTWYYALSVLYLLLSLGFVTIKRLKPFSFKNILFFINHFGLWIILLSAHLGQADKDTINMIVSENQKVWYGFDKKKNRTDLNFAVKLTDFKVTYYNKPLNEAKVSEIENKESNSEIENYFAKVEILTNANETGIPSIIKVNKPLKVNDWKIYLNSYFQLKDGKYVAILTAVRDPWLPIVYTGFIMLFAGTILLLFYKQANNKPE
jgi:hypothetical protein